MVVHALNVALNVKVNVLLTQRTLKMTIVWELFYALQEAQKMLYLDVIIVF